MAVLWKQRKLDSTLQLYIIYIILAVLKYCNYIHLIYAWTCLPSNGHTTVYKLLFMINPSYMQSIEQLRDGPLSVCCMTCLYTCLYDRLEALRDGPLSLACTCPKSEPFMAKDA
jgi:hypothetical protein